jgi:ATP-binding cassette subfamily F protein uup
VTARRKRNVKRLAGLHDLRRQAREPRGPVGAATLTVSETETSGTLVVEARDVAKSYGDRPIVRDLSLRIAKADRLGIVGANGTGKTTLVNLLTGRLPPDSGEVKVGANVTLNLLDQRRSALDPERTVADVLTGGGSDSVQVGGQSRHVIGYMKDFLFSPEQARTPVGVLSGGERNRLLLARALAEAGNLLVLDEPTNDLDLETLDLLQEMLGDYAGTLILVSHDRDFLDRVVDTVLVSEGEGRWVAYAGGYSDMVAQRGVGVQARGVVASKGAKDASREAAKPPARPAAKKRLGFNEQHELKTLPARIAALEGNRAKLRAALDDATLYARDPARFEAISRTLATTEADLAGAEERWLELEMMREELEG